MKAKFIRKIMRTDTQKFIEGEIYEIDERTYQQNKDKFELVKETKKEVTDNGDKK